MEEPSKRQQYKRCCHLYRKLGNLGAAISHANELRREGIICYRGEYAIRLLEHEYKRIEDEFYEMPFSIRSVVIGFGWLVYVDGELVDDRDIYVREKWTQKYGVEPYQFRRGRIGYNTTDDIPF